MELLKFDNEIINDLKEEGYSGNNLEVEFAKRKKQIALLFEKLADEAKSNPALTRKELEDKIF